METTECGICEKCRTETLDPTRTVCGLRLDAKKDEVCDGNIVKYVEMIGARVRIGMRQGVVADGPNNGKWFVKWDTGEEFWHGIDPVHVVCTHESNDVIYVAALGAPGHGHSYKCECGEELWGNDKESAMPFAILDPEDFIMSPDDCI